MKCLQENSVQTNFTDKHVREPNDVDRRGLPSLDDPSHSHLILEIPFAMDTNAIEEATVWFKNRSYTVVDATTMYLMQEANGPCRYLITVTPSRKQRLEDSVAVLTDHCTVELGDAERERFARVLKKFGAGLIQVFACELADSSRARKTAVQLNSHERTFL